MTARDLAAEIGINARHFARILGQAEADGVTWLRRGPRNRFELRPGPAKKALAAMTGARSAGAKLKRAAREAEAPAAGGKKVRRRRGDAPATPPERPPPKVDVPTGTGEPQPRGEIELLEQQIRIYQGILQGIGEIVAAKPTDGEMVRLLNDASTELRQLMKRRREVLEADARTISRELANQRLVTLAQAVKSEWENTPKSWPPIALQALGDHGLEVEDIDRARRVLGVSFGEQVEIILRRLADQLESELA